MSKKKQLIPRYIKETTLEFSVTILYSLLPIIVGTLTLFIDDNDVGFWDSLGKQLERGELYLWATTLMAAVAYSIIKEPPVKWKVLFAFYCAGLCLFMIVYQTVTILKSPQDWFIEASYYVGAATALILFVNMLFEQKTKQNPSQMLHSESNNFANNYEQRRAR